MPERDPVLVALGDALRAVRAERRMSQEELGLATGVHRNYIGGVERGERQPTVAVIAKLAASMDCKLSELFRRAEQFAAGSGDDDMPTLGVRPASSLADSSEGRARQRP